MFGSFKNKKPMGAIVIDKSGTLWYSSAATADELLEHLAKVVDVESRDVFVCCGKSK